MQYVGIGCLSITENEKDFGELLNKLDSNNLLEGRIFDTARCYGQSEIVLGKFHKKLLSANIITKVGINLNPTDPFVKTPEELQK